MKRALVLTLLVLGLGVFAFAGPLSGSWDTDICFDVASDGSVEVKVLDSNLDVAYEVCGWTFSTGLDFGFATGFYNIDFAIDGALGAFQFASKLDFNPQAVNLVEDGMESWQGYVTIAIAGVDLYAGWMLKDDGVTVAPATTTYLAGFMLGGYGTVGDCTLYVEADFGMKPQIWNVYYYGLGTTFAYNWFDVDGTCDLVWSNIDIIAEFPFACLDVVASTGFDCEDGFKGAKFSLAHIDLGLSWLEIKSLDIAFEVDSKAVTVKFGLLTADTICITPHLSVITGTEAQWQFQGISLDALELTYTWNGVTFVASELFANKYYKAKCDPTIKTGTFAYPNEMIGIEIDGDSCCGGAFSAYVYNFFYFKVDGTADPNGEIFNWEHTCVGLDYGISSSVTLNASLVVDKAGLNQMCFGFEFIW